MIWEPVIGIEVHVETNTKTKMFCRCSADYFGAKPNTYVCPVCLGLPGALPFTNEEAIKKCIAIGLALNCQIAEKSIFERKNYFYPDLPKGYQISQYRWPLCINGHIEVEGKSGKKTIRINRAHQEEDTGKLTHRGNETFIDFNRSGVPLVEIVTEADFNGSDQVRSYGKKLQQIIRAIGVSKADMEKGDMRLEANISVRPKGQKELPNYRVELKNINSFKFIADAIDNEIERQIKLHQKGEKIPQQTRGYREDKRETFLQRTKEEANDYRYFPEPDLLPLAVDRELVNKLEQNISRVHPTKKVEYLAKTYKITPSSAQILLTQDMVQIFERIQKAGKTNAQKVANFVINHKINPSDTPQAILARIQGSSQIHNEEELTKMAKEAITNNPKLASDYKSGKTNAIMALVGQVMKLSQGRADPQKARQVLESLLK